MSKLSLYQISTKLFGRIHALPIKKGFNVMCYIFGMMEARGFTKKELKLIETEIIQKELEGKCPSSL